MKLNVTPGDCAGLPHCHEKNEDECLRDLTVVVGSRPMGIDFGRRSWPMSRMGAVL